MSIQEQPRQVQAHAALNVALYSAACQVSKGPVDGAATGYFQRLIPPEYSPRCIHGARCIHEKIYKVTFFEMQQAVMAVLKANTEKDCKVSRATFHICPHTQVL